MDSKSPSNKLIDTRDLLLPWRLLVKNFFLLTILPLAAYAVGYIYTYRLANVYGAKIQLLLKSNETYDYQDPIYKGLGAYGIYMDVQNQMRILKSRDLLGEVVDKIDASTSYYIVGRLKKHEVYGTLPFECTFTALNPAIYEIPIQVVISDKESYSLSYEIAGEPKSFSYKFDEEVISEDFVIKLQRRYTFSDENIQTITSSNYEVVMHSRDNLINKYKSAMDVENIEHTSVLNVTVTDPIQLRAKVFLDTLSAVYIDFSKRTQLEVNLNTVENIDRQIDTILVMIQEKENELLRYKDVNAILSPIQEESQYFKDFVEFSSQKRILDKKISSIDALENYLENTDDEHVLPPFFYIEESDFYLREAINEVRNLQVDLELKKAKESDENFNVKMIKKKISLLISDILNYLGNLRVALEKERIKTEEYISKYKSEIRELPKSEQGIMNIQRELDVKNKMYLFLLEKKTNTLIARAGIIPQVQVIESAVSIGVVEPNKVKIIRLFILGGFLLALFIAIIRKLFFEKISNVNELSEATSLNIVGGLPYVKNLKNPLVTSFNPKSQVTEGFRTIRTNLSYLGQGEDHRRTILVSSYFPGEGKTFASSNLASLFAMSDKKVILLDFDLHKPKVHKTFELNNEKGISTFLAGFDSVEDVVHKSVSEGLDVICTGPIPPNPSELILNKRTADLFEWAKTNYDYVIIDTPPFGLLNDGMELLKFADIFVVILNTKFARKRGVHMTEELLSKSSGYSVGLVLNGVKNSGIQYYYAKYTYKYSYTKYGYSYGSYGETYGEDPD